MQQALLPPTQPPSKSPSPTITQPKSFACLNSIASLKISFKLSYSPKVTLHYRHLSDLSLTCTLYAGGREWPSIEC